VQRRRELATAASTEPIPFHPGQGLWQHVATMRRIRRYSNRKLYDTTNSHYVTLAQIAAMVRAGDDVQVLEYSSGRDITAATLAQTIFEVEKRSSRSGPGVLRDIIRTGQIPSGRAQS